MGAPSIRPLPAPAPPAGTDGAGARGAGAQPDAQGASVLVVEDAPQAGAAIVQILEAGGYRVRWVRSVSEARAELGGSPPDLVVLDLGLPDGDGLELLRQVKGTPDTALLPVIVVTGLVELERHAVAAGADAWFPKPPDPDALRVRARVLAETWRIHQGMVARRARLAAENVELRKWVRFVAHDLRNLAGAAQVNARFARERLRREPGEAAEALDDVIDGLGRIEALAHEVVSSERLADGRLALRLGEVSLAALASAAGEELRPLAGEGGVQVTGDARVRADPDLVRRVFANLIGNALAHAGEGPVRVAIRASEVAAVVEVRDRGQGVPAALKERLSRSVTRILGDTADGHGLGLAFCKFAVEAHGGRLGVRQATGGGSTFWFLLPLGPRSPSADG